MNSFLLLVSLISSAVSAAEIIIPETSTRYRVDVQRAAGEYFGLNASPARLAAQLHQESGWRTDAQSRFAQGPAQFTPATARWLPAVCPEVGPPDPWAPHWAIRAAACYDAWLHRRVKPMAGTLRPCSRWVYTLRGYNGGEGWLTRERRAAQALNRDPDDWLAVESIRLRATWAHSENIRYPRRILLTLEPAYINAGWMGQLICKEI